MNRRKNLRRRKKLPEFVPNVLNTYMRNRLVIFIMIVVGALAFLGCYIAYIQAQNGSDYAKYVLNNQAYDSVVLPFKRGDIRDRSGTVLAFSSKVYNLILDPAVILYTETNDPQPKYKETTIEALVKCFDLSRSEIESVLSSKSTSHYVKFRKGLTDDDIAVFKALQNGENPTVTIENEDGSVITEAISVEDRTKIKGVWFEEEYVRSYPYGSLACDVIGFAGSASNGEIGLENYYNDYLMGVNGVTYGYVNEELNLEKTTKSPIDGYNIVTTLDFSVQSIIERHIKEFNEQYGSKNTAVMVMNPNNGEIIAEASYPVFDLSNPRSLQGNYTEEQLAEMSEEDMKTALYSLWRNFCVSDVYEPGSTMKPFTIAAGLEEGLLNGTEEYFCDGFEKILGHTIKCHLVWGHGTLTLEETIMQSCNDALMQIGLKLGSKLTEKYQDIFGYGRKTYVDLPGEEAGITKSSANMDDADVATNAFGQNFNVTMTQLAAAYCSLINGGYYYQPHLVKRIETSNGEVVKSFDGTLVKQTITESTSAFLRQAMYRTVKEGTAKKVGVNGYLIGGKTGTAEKSPRGTNLYVISFIGFAPIEDPQFMIYVVIDEPHVEALGSSAPVCYLAHDILEDILPYLNVFPVEEEEPNSTNTGKDVDEYAVSTNANNLVDVAPETPETTAADNQTQSN